MSDQKLAIVIPAYKAEYFDQTLASIAWQSDTRFTLYIGDDASTEDLSSIVEKYNSRIDIVYRRFPENLGGKSLVRQWMRCVDLTHEEWIWVFGDDDIMPKDAVKSFYDFLHSDTRFDVVRFNLAVIDHQGEILYGATSHPGHESSAQFASRVLDRSCRSSASEFIFSRDVYLGTGGFVEFPLGWASDVASWIRFGMEKGIYTIGNEPVRWRLSGNNLSSRQDDHVYLHKIDACIEFTGFLRQHFKLPEDVLFDWMFFHFSLLTKGRRKLNKKLMHIKFVGKVAASRPGSVPAMLRFYKNRKCTYFRKKLWSLRYDLPFGPQ
ncbi:glycosyltransferase family 2 protein [Methyloterricola oryzae]|uniref:glycosyltransferase family 2 protein n=1 Tax=Methyloterricola oryzae TaxID=1495050 RepID=UPI00069A10B5|nr:glycosyltransferase family 2 protein [Methyloterricola oryzae]